MHSPQSSTHTYTHNSTRGVEWLYTILVTRQQVMISCSVARDNRNISPHNATFTNNNTTKSIHAHEIFDNVQFTFVDKHATRFIAFIPPDKNVILFPKLTIWAFNTTQHSHTYTQHMTCQYNMRNIPNSNNYLILHLKLYHAKHLTWSTGHHDSFHATHSITQTTPNQSPLLP